MKCHGPSGPLNPLPCDNEGRYIDVQGVVRCGLCDIAASVISIRLSDIPGLLDHVITILWGSEPYDEHVAKVYKAIFSMIVKPGVTAPLKFEYPKLFSSAVDTSKPWRCRACDHRSETYKAFQEHFAAEHGSEEEWERTHREAT